MGVFNRGRCLRVMVALPVLRCPAASEFDVRRVEDGGGSHARVSLRCGGARCGGPELTSPCAPLDGRCAASRSRVRLCVRKRFLPRRGVIRAGHRVYGSWCGRALHACEHGGVVPCVRLLLTDIYGPCETQPPPSGAGGVWLAPRERGARGGGHARARSRASAATITHRRG